MAPPLLRVLLLAAAVAAVRLGQGKAGSYCRNYGGCYPHGHPPPKPDQPYLPAPPGKTPRCARPGATYCETVDHYPTHLVQYLIDRWAFDMNTLLRSETTEDFDSRYPVTYGPPSNALLAAEGSANASAAPQRAQGARGPGRGLQPAPSYGPPGHSPGLPLGPVQLTQGGAQGGQAGYPDRRYRLDPSQTAITYAPTRQQQQQPPVSANPTALSAWTRLRRELARSGARRARRQTDAGTTTLCPTTFNFVTPQAALNTQGNWMFVANLAGQAPAQGDRQRYTQLVRTETCVSSECDGVCALPAGFTSRCRQQYVQKRLVALGGAGDRLYQDTFWFPHCCLCEIASAQ